MSDHCWICGNPDNWIRGKERPNDSEMMLLNFKNMSKHYITGTYVVHIDCFLRAIRNAQNRYMTDGEIIELDEMKKDFQGELCKKNPNYKKFKIGVKE